MRPTGLLILLTALISHPAYSQPTPPAIPEPPDYVAARAKRLNDAWADLNRRLEKPVSLSPVEVPLERVAKEIAEQIKAPLRIDEPALTDEAIAIDLPVTMHIDGLAAEEAFHTLERHGVTVTIDGTSLLLTTQTAADEMQLVRVYPVSDIVVFEQDGKTLVDFTQLREMIKNVTKPWFDIDGIGGTILPLSIRDSHILVVWQTTAVHREIEKLLYDVRHAVKAGHVEQPIPADRPELPAAAPPAIPPAVHIAAPVTPDYVVTRVSRVESARRAYQRAMVLAVDLSFESTPLREVIETLLGKIGMPIEYDEAAIVEEAIDLQASVTMTFKHRTLEEAIDELLEQHGLDHALIGRRIVVFSATGCSIGLEVVRLYPVDDLIANVEADGRTQHDSSELEGVIQNNTKPWFDIDGVGGTIRHINAGGRHLLAIRQTEPVHEEIEDLLYRIRKAKTSDDTTRR